MTCPGVWLCQSGPIKLILRTLGYTFHTNAVRPRFPLIYHEPFTIEGYFKDVHTADDLRRKLINSPVEFALYQNGHRLAYFRESLAALLSHQNCNRDLIDLELLMSTTKCFPGILSPKVESQIEFTVRKYNPTDDDYDCVHATKNKDGGGGLGICWGSGGRGDGGGIRGLCNNQQQHRHNHEKSPQAGFKRQRAVCHHQTHVNSENAVNFVPVRIVKKEVVVDTSTSERNRHEQRIQTGVVVEGMQFK